MLIGFFIFLFVVNIESNVSRSNVNLNTQTCVWITKASSSILNSCIRVKLHLIDIGLVIVSLGSVKLKIDVKMTKIQKAIDILNSL